MYILGLDIGTTGICGLVLNAQNGETVDCLTRPNNTFLAQYPQDRRQDPNAILTICLELVNTLCDRYTDIVSIGVTGQMHGILYLDKDGSVLSPLYTWQDACGEALNSDGVRYVKQLSNLTGYAMASGFGGTTYYVHTCQGAVPQNAAVITTVYDYVAMYLAGRKSPLMHVSSAASLGLFDLAAQQFDQAAIERAGMVYELFPSVINRGAQLGKYRNIPVICAIGDNQASFIGSVSDTETDLLINVGTGSQITLATHGVHKCEMECRPLDQDTYLLVGSALCGGRAFAYLEQLFREIASGVTGLEVTSAYPYMDSLLKNATATDHTLFVDTRFDGTRADPTIRGCINGIDTQNLSAQMLVRGVIQGIARELTDYYDALPPEKTASVRNLIGSGNGLRRNAALCECFSSSLGMQIKLPTHKEEAAYGAALYSATACGVFSSLNQAQKLIRYTSACQ